VRGTLNCLGGLIVPLTQSEFVEIFV